MQAYIVNLSGKRISKIVTTERGVEKLRAKIRLGVNRKNGNVLKIEN